MALFALFVRPTHADTTTSFYLSTGDDGSIVYNDVTWAATHDASSGNLAGTTLGGVYAAKITQWYVGRFFLNFDTSALPDDATISSATIYVYGESKNGALARTYNIYDGAQHETLITGDYDDCGTSAYSSNIAHSAFTTGAYNGWALNSSGIANISTSTNSKFCIRETTYDAPDSSPSDYENIYIRNTSYAGTSSDPYISITYTVPTPTSTPDTTTTLNYYITLPNGTNYWFGSTTIASGSPTTTYFQWPTSSSFMDNSITEHFVLYYMAALIIGGIWVVYYVGFKKK